MILECLKLFYSFFKVGLMGFGGGYAMLSMIMSESERFSVSIEQFADLNALDMVVPGPIAINAATYVGYLHAGFLGALASTIGVSLPSFILVILVMRLLMIYKSNKVVDSFLLGVRACAVGLILVATVTIASAVLLNPGGSLSSLLSAPFATLSFVSVFIFIATAIANIHFNINPILLTVLAGIVGAIWAG